MQALYFTHLKAQQSIRIGNYHSSIQQIHTHQATPITRHAPGAALQGRAKEVSPCTQRAYVQVVQGTMKAVSTRQRQLPWFVVGQNQEGKNSSRNKGTLCLQWETGRGRIGQGQRNRGVSLHSAFETTVRTLDLFHLTAKYRRRVIWSAVSYKKSTLMGNWT